MRALPNVAKNYFLSIFGILLISVISAVASYGAPLSPEEECLINLLENADDSMSVGELRKHCRQKLASDEASPVKKRLNKDKENILEPFTLMSHRPNYIMPYAHNFNGYDAALYRQQLHDPSFSFDHTEVQFQISIKTPLWTNISGRNIDIFAAYTNRSFWQLYNNRSSPFRETNHEPEAWIQFRPGWEIFGISNNVNSFGINHQSNGKGGVLSRSWNRIYASFIFSKGRFAFNFRPWYRINEDLEDDDNPDITDYMGHYELRAAYKWDNHVFTFMSRNNIESDFSKGAVEFTWSFPVGNYPYLKGYMQYFHGYGESLIDYKNKINRIGFGVAITDWL